MSACFPARLLNSWPVELPWRQMPGALGISAAKSVALSNLGFQGPRPRGSPPGKWPKSQGSQAPHFFPGSHTLQPRPHSPCGLPALWAAVSQRILNVLCLFPMGTKPNFGILQSSQTRMTFLHTVLHKALCSQLEFWLLVTAFLPPWDPPKGMESQNSSFSQRKWS